VSNNDSKPLIAALQGPSKRRRKPRAMGRAIGKLRDRRTLRKLCALLDDPSDIVSIEAAITIGELGNKTALAKLELTPRANNHHSAFGSVSQVFAEQAVRLRSRLSARELQQDIKRLIKALKNNDPSVRERARHGLGTIGGPAVPALVRALRSKNERRRLEAAKAAGAIKQKDERLTEPLARRLEDAAVGVRREAAHALRKHGDQECVEALLESLDDATAEVRLEAVLTLGYLGDARALEPLDRLAAHDPGPGASEVQLEIRRGAAEVSTAIRKRMA
jgi:HEAT repeat protein